ncbi:MAG: hypothetical protein LCH34_10495 [Firmicutes bacterium]|nr:hypothetical protein [Bacillota bacterium]
MKKGDLLWGAGLTAVIAFMVFPATHEIFESMTMNHPYMMGFIKFGILATMGELMAIRINAGYYKKPVGLVWKSLIWGFIGMLITLMFTIFSGGVLAAQAKGILPFEGNTFAFAFFTSAIMNGVFAPTFMAFHRYTDTYIELNAMGKSASITDITKEIDWNNFVNFVVLKTIPFFWIPAHTATFMLPAEYRILVAAFLSIALGAILAFAKRSKQ